MMSQDFRPLSRANKAKLRDGMDFLTSQCDEIILMIIFWLDGKSIIQLAQTCSRLYRVCSFDEQLWCRLCRNDYEIHLSTSQPFPSFKKLYICLYQSRKVLMLYLASEHGINCR